MPDALDALVLRVGQEDRHSGLPVALFTGTGDDPRPRLRVDQAQTSYYEGREFRLYHEFNIAAGTSVFIKYTFDKNISVHGRTLSVMEGKLRLGLSTGGIESGVWTPKSIHKLNSMTDTPAYVGTSLAWTGGSVSGSTERDVMLLETGVSANAISVRAEIAETGLPPGTYYIELRNTGSGAVRGVYAAHWEEREPRSSRLY